MSVGEFSHQLGETVTREESADLLVMGVGRRVIM